MQDAGGRPDPESSEYKEVEKLLKQMYVASAGSVVATISVDAIIQDLEKRRKLIEGRGEVYQTELETKSQLLATGRRSERLIREKIKLLIASGDTSSSELETLQEELKTLNKTNKLNASYIKGEEKGAAVAEEILKMTFGISQNSVNIVGFIEGFGKNLKKSLTLTNLTATMLIKVFESFLQIDGTTSALFKKVGVDKDRYVDDIIDTGADLALAFGVNSKEVAGEIYAELITARRSIGMITDGELKRMATTAGKLSRMNVSVTAYSDLATFMSLNLDQDLDKQEHTLGMFYKLAKETKSSPEQVFREVASSLPVYSRYLNDFPRVFAGIHLAAKRTNVDINDLMTLTESLDTTDQALKQAQKFNALLGGNFLNPIALLAADPGQKVKLISEAYRKAQESLGDIHPRVVRSLYQNFGLDAQRFKNIVNASFESFDDELNQVTTGDIDLQTQVAKDIEDSKSAGETMQNALNHISQTLMKGLLKGVVKVADYVMFLVQSLGGGVGSFVRRLLGLDKTQAQIQQEAVEENKKQVLASMPELDSSLQKSVSSMSPEVARMALGIPSSGPVSPALDQYVNTITNPSPIMQRIAIDDMKMQAEGRGDVDIFDIDDSPVVMNVGPSRPIAQVPTINAKYETSSQDDVLLSRLGKLRDKIHEYRQKSTKINLNVGLNSIAEATV